MQLEDEPIKLGADAQEYLAHDMNQVSGISKDCAVTLGSRGKEQVLIPLSGHQPDRNTSLG